MVQIIPFQEIFLDPSDIKAMSMALDDVCMALKLDGNIEAREVMVKRIIELARMGERNPTRSRDTVLKEAKWGTSDIAGCDLSAHEASVVRL